MGQISFFIGLAAMAATLWFHNDAATAYKHLLSTQGVAAADMFTVSIESKVIASAPGLLGVALGGIGLQKKAKWSKAGIVFSTAAIILAIIPTWRFFV